MGTSLISTSATTRSSFAFDAAGGFPTLRTWTRKLESIKNIDKNGKRTKYLIDCSVQTPLGECLVLFFKIILESELGFFPLYPFWKSWSAYLRGLQLAFGHQHGIDLGSHRGCSVEGPGGCSLSLPRPTRTRARLVPFAAAAGSTRWREFKSIWNKRCWNKGKQVQSKSGSAPTNDYLKVSLWTPSTLPFSNSAVITQSCVFNRQRLSGSEAQLEPTNDNRPPWFPNPLTAAKSRRR